MAKKRNSDRKGMKMKKNGHWKKTAEGVAKRTRKWKKGENKKVLKMTNEYERKKWKIGKRNYWGKQTRASKVKENGQGKNVNS